MKYQLINTNEIKVGVPEHNMFRGMPWSISIEERDGYWYSKWQVVLHCPSPTGDSSDWIQLDVGCLNKEQAIIIAKEYATRNDIPLSRVVIQARDTGYHKTLDDSEFSGGFF
jgi:hypothetical protein